MSGLLSSRSRIPPARRSALLSKPTWSKGKVLYASGVQFPDVKYQGQTFHPGQGNNFYIYPAIGLATYVARPSRITEECFILAAQATADQIDPDLRDKGWLYPSQSNI